VKLLPRSLLGQTVLMIALVLLLSTLTSNVLVYYYFIKPRFQDQLILIGQNLNNLYNTLLFLPDEQRQLFIERMSQEKQFLVRATDDFERPYQSMSHYPQLQQLITHYVFPSFDKNMDVRVQKSDKRIVWFKSPIAEQPYWIGVPFSHIQSRFPWVAVMWLMIVSILTVLASFWLVSRINRSLGYLARAAEKMGQGKQPTQLLEVGPSEIKKVSHAFNNMVQDIKVLTDNHTLLLAGVSHDLRTPLARMRLSVEMLSAGTLDELKSEITHDLEIMDDMIEQFLLFVRDGSDEPFIPSDLNELIIAVCKRYNIQKQIIQLQLTQLPIITIRHIAIQRLLINLFDNATCFDNAAQNHPLPLPKIVSLDSYVQ